MYYTLILIGTIYTIAIVIQIAACATATKQANAKDEESFDGAELTPEPCAE